MFRPIRFAVLLAGATLAFSVLAQPAPDEPPPPPDGQDQPAADPPSRVARLSFVRGDVSFVPAGENDWVEAQLNRPLVTGDKLWTDRGSRAELEIGGSAMRMDQNTSFDFLNLDDKTAQIELTQGSLNLRVRRLYDEQSYEVDTPTLAFVINRVGEYRIDVLPNGQSTVVTVLHGGGDAYGEGGARFRVEEGQAVTFNDPQLQNYDAAGIPRPDDFDDFALQRDHRWDEAHSRRYVSEEVIGYEDLDDNGEWTEVAEYGNVWYPTTVAVGWTPYHYGHWGWVGAYGWTWIDDAPWGFAPFHYGRWAYIGGRWGWCPGPVAVRPVYAPALVAFVGGGVGVSVSFGTGPVGWFPLGPRDVYFPSYHVSERYFTSINISNTRVVNTTVINNYYGGYARGNLDYSHIEYANRGVAGAVVAVPHEAFVAARPVAASAIAVNRETFANARVSPVAAVAPTRASVAVGLAARATPPAAVVNRPIVAASKPPAPILPFAQRQAALQKNPGQPLSANQLHVPVTGTTAASAAAAHPNLRVVTSTGTPAHTAAPTLPHATAGNAAAVNRNTLPAVQNGALTNTGTGKPPATTVQGTSRLNSSGFAHGQSPANATTPASHTGTNATTGGQTQAVHATAPTQTLQQQRAPATTMGGNMAATGATNTGKPSNSNATQTIHNATPTTTPTYSKPTSSPYTNTNNAASGRDSAYSARGSAGSQPLNKPEYHQTTTPNAAAQNTVHSNPQVQQQTTVHPNAQQFQQVQQHQQQPQFQQQQQVQHQQQPQFQQQVQHQQPPPVQQHAPPQTHNPPPNNSRSDPKKDDDKHH
ncbi:MAG TPA: DUF6600 domain-containing protein [Rudaea sp.]|nr:DUF6600 domain-containing protein [Rudaea sp.]